MPYLRLFCSTSSCVKQGSGLNQHESAHFGVDAAHVWILAGQGKLTLIRLALGERAGAPGAAWTSPGHVVAFVATVHPAHHRALLHLDLAWLITVVDDVDFGQASGRRA